MPIKFFPKIEKQRQKNEKKRKQHLHTFLSKIMNFLFVSLKNIKQQIHTHTYTQRYIFNTQLIFWFKTKLLITEKKSKFSSSNAHLVLAFIFYLSLCLSSLSFSFSWPIKKIHQKKITKLLCPLRPPPNNHTFFIIIIIIWYS